MGVMAQRIGRHQHKMSTKQHLGNIKRPITGAANEETHGDVINDNNGDHSKKRSYQATESFVKGVDGPDNGIHGEDLGIGLFEQVVRRIVKHAG